MSSSPDSKDKRVAEHPWHWYHTLQYLHITEMNWRLRKAVGSRYTVKGVELISPRESDHRTREFESWIKAIRDDYEKDTETVRRRRFLGRR